MGERELSLDTKGIASQIMGDTIQQTRDNFPEPQYRPRLIKNTTRYPIYS